MSPRRVLHLAATIAAASCGGGFVYRPATPAELAGHLEFDWIRDTTPHFRLYVDSDAPAARRIPQLKREVEASYRRIEEVLGRAPDAAEPVHVFQVASRDDVRKLTGLRVNGFAYPETGVVVGIEIDGRSAATSPHEIMHVFQYRHFGSGGIGTTWGSLALNEGMAVFASGNWHGRDLHELAREIRASGRGASARALLAEGRAAVSDDVLYPLAGSFVRFLHERYGADLVYRYYERQFESDTSELEAVFGRTAVELDADWSEALAGAGS